MRKLRALMVLPVVLLSGCGIAGAQFHPGVAAQVGDETITTRHIAQVTDSYCKAVETVSKTQPQQGGSTPTPLRYLTHEFASDLVVKAAAEQLADQYDVKTTSAYTSALAQLAPQISNLSDAQQAAVREVIGARSYAQDVLTQIGDIALKKQGNDSATDDDQYAEGQKLLKAWADDHHVEVNPKYAITFGTGEQVDTDTSVAVSSQAKAGLGESPDADYTAQLSDNLVCLD